MSVAATHLQFGLRFWCQQLHKARQHTQRHDLVNRGILFCKETDNAASTKTHYREGWGRGRGRGGGEGGVGVGSEGGGGVGSEGVMGGGS